MPLGGPLEVNFFDFRFVSFFEFSHFRQFGKQMPRALKKYFGKDIFEASPENLSDFVLSKNILGSRDTSTRFVMFVDPVAG